MIHASELSAWLAVPVAFFLVLGGSIVLIGALGLFKLRNFYQRIHGPAMTITLGAGGIIIASMLMFSGLEGRPVIQELLITIFVLLSAPVVAMMLMRAAVYRDLRAGRQIFRDAARAKGAAPGAEGQAEGDARTDTLDDGPGSDKGP